MKNFLWALLVVGFVALGILFFFKRQETAKDADETKSQEQEGFEEENDTLDIFELQDNAAVSQFVQNLFRAIRFNNPSKINEYLDDLADADSPTITKIVRAWMNNKEVQSAGYQNLTATLRKLQCGNGIKCALVQEAIQNIQFQYENSPVVVENGGSLGTRVRIIIPS